MLVFLVCRKSAKKGKQKTLILSESMGRKLDDLFCAELLLALTMMFLSFENHPSQINVSGVDSLISSDFNLCLLVDSKHKDGSKMCAWAKKGTGWKRDPGKMTRLRYLKITTVDVDQR